MVALQVCNAEIYQHPHHRIGEIKFKRAPFVKERHPNTDQKQKTGTQASNAFSVCVLYICSTMG